MYRIRLRLLLISTVFVILFITSTATAQSGSIQGIVRNSQGDPVHHASILVVQTGQTAETNHSGEYRIEGLEPGSYDLFAEAANFTSRVNFITVESGETVELNMQLELSPVRDSVTVTARGRHETTFEAVQAVNSLDTFDIAEEMATSIGEVLEEELGVAKRSFGPGSSRPVIRGFDGDRVLVLDDGMRVGSLGSQSGDHGEPIDPGQLERLEVVKGPATLLYGSNAIGGVVNAISRHHEMHKHQHEGMRGQITSALGSNNGLAGANISAEYGTGQWMAWAGGGGQRTGDYDSPAGTVENSKSRISNGSFGVGWFGEKGYLSAGYKIRDGRYGVPFADELHGHHGEEHGDEEEDSHEGEEPHEEEGELEAVDLDWRYHNVRVNTGLTRLGSFFENLRIGLNYGEWRHDEVELFPGDVEEIGTAFRNDQFTYRADIDHRRGPLSGTFGLWGTSRDFSATGEEALSPPVDQNGFAAFALEEVNLERVRLQLGGRLEHTRYEPTGPFERGEHGHEHEEGDEAHEGEEEPELIFLPERDLTGFSGSAGLRVRLWESGAFVGHFTSAYRAPALEELYNFGPHVGNLAFEIGNPDLEGERSNGFDLSLRHSGERVRLEGNFFFYDISDFIFPAPTGEVEDGLFVLEYEQGDSRFTGVELGLDFALQDWLWLSTGIDAVEAELTAGDTPLPRIPPLRGRVGLDFRYDRLSVRPEVVLAADQDDLFPTETRTAGYGVVNLEAAYTLPRQHYIHHFAFEIFNAGDKLYRNHVSFIKDLAPEMGRGVKFSYAVKFF